MKKIRKKKRKRLRLKSSVKRFLIYFIFILCLSIYTIKESFAIYKDFKYQETYEYKLIQLGYTKKESTALIKYLKPKVIDSILLEEEKNEHYYNIVTQKYYIEENFQSYVDYKLYHLSTDYKDVIAIVNVNAHHGWYNKLYKTDINDGYLMLVNKFYGLDKTYKREDLQSVNLAYAYANNSVSSIVIENFENMRADVQTELGVRLMVNSSYRSYEDQEAIYNDFKNISLKYADSYAARPGHSEHQTGLAIDITSLEHPYINNTDNSFDNSPEYEWLKKNCHKYGFILRYPKGKEHITGYSTESWHFRYVGVKAATKMYEEDLTLDEYYAYYIAK